jgi:hypothetical protein
MQNNLGDNNYFNDIGRYFEPPTTIGGSSQLLDIRVRWQFSIIIRFSSLFGEFISVLVKETSILANTLCKLVAKYHRTNCFVSNFDKFYLKFIFGYYSMYHKSYT